MHVIINIESGVPIYLQIAEQIRQIAAAGGMAAGDKLPSVRNLAVRIRVNPNTVQAAYRQLESEGMVTTRKGLGVFLSDAAAKMPAKERAGAMTAILDQAALRAHHLAIDHATALRLFEERLEAVRQRIVTSDEKGGNSR